MKTITFKHVVVYKDSNKPEQGILFQGIVREVTEYLSCDCSYNSNHSLTYVTSAHSYKKRGLKMAPRARKIPCTSGLVFFSAGVTEEQVQEFLKRNGIDRVPGKPKWMTSMTNTAIQVPPADEYIVPDDVYVWVATEHCK
jgi:hypothetical protein